MMQLVEAWVMVVVVVDVSRLYKSQNKVSSFSSFSSSSSFSFARCQDNLFDIWMNRSDNLHHLAFYA